VDQGSTITFSSLPSSQIDVTKRLAAHEAFKVVIGDEVYAQDWFAPDLAKVIDNGIPVQTPWDEIHPPEGANNSLVLPCFTFAILFVVNIPGQPRNNELVLTPKSITRILDGLATNWTDGEITADNLWINSLSPAPGFIKVRAKYLVSYQHVKRLCTLSTKSPELYSYLTQDRLSTILYILSIVIHTGSWTGVCKVSRLCHWY